jgi:hypothetical protein
MGSQELNKIQYKRILTHGLLVTGLVSYLTGCIGNSSENAGESGVKIVGGQLESGHPEVLRVLTGNNPVRVCTGVVISETVMLMAGHCVTDKTLTEGVTVEKASAVAASASKLNSKLIVGYNALRGVERINPSSARYDLAAVVYPKGTFQPPYAKISSTPSQKGDIVKLIGYGASSFEDIIANVPVDGRKRSGTNTLIDAKNGLYFLEANIKSKNLTNNAVAAFGDSGGPVYRNGEFIGIVAGLYFTDARGLIKVPSDASGNPILPLAQATMAGNAIVDLQSPEAQAVIDAANAANPLALDQTKVAISQQGDEYLAVCFGGGGNNPLGGGSNRGGDGSGGRRGPLGGLIDRLLGAFGGGGIGGQTPVAPQGAGEDGKKTG